MKSEDRFLFKLCIVLGYKSIRELKDTMSQKELFQWVEYYSHEPFHMDRVELQLAQISDILVKTAGEKKTSPIDFMLSVSEDDKFKHKLAEKQKHVIEQLQNF